MPAYPKGRAILIGLGVTLGTLLLGCAIFVLAILFSAGGNNLAAGWSFLVFSPVLIWLLVASIAFGLWRSHRAYRRALAAEVRYRTEA